MLAFRLTTFSVVVLIIVLAAGTFFREEKGISFLSANQSIMKNITINHFKNSSLQWKSFIRRARISRDASETSLENITMYYPERDLTLTATTGYYDFRSGEISLSGRVSGTGDNLTFESPELHYDPSEKTVLASRELTVRGNNYMITADSGKIIDSRILKADGNVRALFY